MKKKLALGLTILFLVALAIPVASADETVKITPQPPAWNAANQVNLTDTQKQELNSLWEQILNLRKQLVQKYVDYGLITEDQGKARIDWMEQRQKYMEENGWYCPGMGAGMGPGMGGRMMHHGFHGGFRGGPWSNNGS